MREGLGIDPETIFELEQEFHRPVRRAEREMRNAFLDRFLWHKEGRRETSDKLVGCGLFGNSLEAGGTEKTGVTKFVGDAIQLPLGGQTTIDGDHKDVAVCFKEAAALDFNGSPDLHEPNILFFKEGRQIGEGHCSYPAGISQCAGENFGSTFICRECEA